MSEVKIREEKCSVRSPCKDTDRVCNLNRGDCEYPSSVITFYIKDKGYTGDISTIIQKINQEYGHIINTATCNLSSIETDIGKTYKKIKDSLEKGNMLGFYFPKTDQVLCQKNDSSKMKHVLGITINSREVKQLKMRTLKMMEHFTTTKKEETFLQLSPLVPDVYVKQFQFNNMTRQGFTFFVLLPTNMRWISVNEGYQNFDITNRKYGDTLYMIIPISANKVTESKTDKERIEQKYCNTSYNRYQNVLLNKTKELYSAIVKDEGNIKHINKKLIQTEVQLKSNPNNKRLIRLKIKLESYVKMIEYMRKLKPREKMKYPYWYSFDKPIGQKLRSIGKLKPYEYNNHYINPVYAGKTEFLVCQSKDINYQVNLYACEDKERIVYALYLSDLLRIFGEKKYYVKIPLNKLIQDEDITELKRLTNISAIANQEIDIGPIPIYCIKVTSIFNIGSIIYYGTSKNEVERFYDSIMGKEYKKKSLLKLDINNKDIRHPTFTTVKEEVSESSYEIKMLNLDDDSLNYSSEDEGNDEGNDDVENDYGFVENIDHNQDEEDLKQQLVDSLEEYADYLLLERFNFNENQIELLAPRIRNIYYQFSINNYATREIMLTTYRDYKRAITDIVRRVAA